MLLPFKNPPHCEGGRTKGCLLSDAFVQQQVSCHVLCPTTPLNVFQFSPKRKARVAFFTSSCKKPEKKQRQNCAERHKRHGSLFKSMKICLYVWKTDDFVSMSLLAIWGITEKQGGNRVQSSSTTPLTKLRRRTNFSLSSLNFFFPFPFLLFFFPKDLIFLVKVSISSKRLRLRWCCAVETREIFIPDQTKETMYIPFD